MPVHHSTTENHPMLRVAECCGWLAVLIGLAFAESIAASGGVVFAAIRWMGVLLVAFGLRAFLFHGGCRITTLGLFNAASAFFVGFGAIQESITPQGRTPAVYLTMAVVIAGTVQILVTFLLWSQDKVRATPPRSAAIPEALWVIRAGWVVLLGLLFIASVGVVAIPQIHTEAAAFTAVTLIAIGTLFMPGGSRLPWRLAPVVIAFALYIAFFHGGTGRLRMVALGCVIAILFTARFPRRSHKWGIVLATPGLVLLLAESRLRLQEDLARGASTGNTGLESATEPILVFAQVIHAQMELAWPLAIGRTLVTIPLSFVPDELTSPTWPDPFGYELARIAAPHLYGTGYTAAATVYGEFWYNFSAIGILLLFPLLYWLLGFLDRNLERSLHQASECRGRLVQLAFWVMLSGSIGDLIWMGTHAWGARMLVRLPVLLALIAAAAVLKRHGQMSSDPGALRPRAAGSLWPDARRLKG